MKALNPKQIQTAQLLASGATITAAAEQLEITRTTIHDWLKVTTLPQTSLIRQPMLFESLLVGCILCSPSFVDSSIFDNKPAHKILF